MEEEKKEHHPHLQPLLHPPSTPAATPPADHRIPDNLNLVQSSSTIALRFSFVAFIGIVSVWANHEASKGYAVSVVNGAHGTVAGKRFQLFYASNDEAVRVLVKTSDFVQAILYPDDDKKPVSHVVLELTGHDLTDDVIVQRRAGTGEFVVRISRSVMEGPDYDRAVVRAVRKGAARVWIWDGRGRAPMNLVNGIVELLAGELGGPRAMPGPLDSADGACWTREDPREVAEFLRYCEVRAGPGFVGRLNRAMKDGWEDGMLEGLLGQLCRDYHESLGYNVSSA
ncbi:Plant basic secretory protein (BSP) family protein [Striga hermonthica]|uniref:Plant basic secretory protein (BSP) family protein n=1 Tax=Striga hermonthica TaxID=68872 RepID=A0A9N7R896_STRHE|nr:Plant basic secretory protein (BSP) family protein [Striga hermonthica]